MRTQLNINYPDSGEMDGENTYVWPFYDGPLPVKGNTVTIFPNNIMEGMSLEVLTVDIELHRQQNMIHLNVYCREA